MTAHLLMLRLGRALRAAARRAASACADAMARWSERRYEAWRSGPQSHRRY